MKKSMETEVKTTKNSIPSFKSWDSRWIDTDEFGKIICEWHNTKIALKDTPSFTLAEIVNAVRLCQDMKETNESSILN